MPSPAFAAAIAKIRKAAKVFAAFPASQQREYVEWIDEARREDTRAPHHPGVEWIAEGKVRHWKYADW